MRGRLMTSAGRCASASLVAVSCLGAAPAGATGPLRPARSAVRGFVELCGGPAPGRCFVGTIGIGVTPAETLTSDRVLIRNARGRRVAEQTLRYARFYIPLRPGSYTAELLGDGVHIRGRVMRARPFTVRAHSTTVAGFLFSIK